MLEGDYLMCRGARASAAGADYGRKLVQLSHGARHRHIELDEPVNDLTGPLDVVIQEAAARA